MPTITVFTFDKLPGVIELCKLLNIKNISEAQINAKLSKYNKDEVFVQYWYYEDIEDTLKSVFSENDGYEIVSFLKDNGKEKVLKRTYCFINLVTKTLEVYRGPDQKTQEIVSVLERSLNVKFIPISVKPEELKRLYSQHSTELKQVMFKNIYGLVYDILRGNCLENNERFTQYLQSFPESLRVVTFRPKIKFLNNYNKYQVTVNGDKGTIRISSNEVFQWRPRFEIRQLVFILASVIGLLPS
jgi:hypothetical protein